MTEGDRWISKNAELVWVGANDQKHAALNQQPKKCPKTCHQFTCLQSEAEDRNRSLCDDLFQLNSGYGYWKWHMLSWENDDISEIMVKLWELNYTKFRAWANIIPHNIAVICNSRLTLTRLLLSAEEFLFPKRQLSRIIDKNQSLTFRLMLITFFLKQHKGLWGNLNVSFCNSVEIFMKALCLETWDRPRPRVDPRTICWKSLMF